MSAQQELHVLVRPHRSRVPVLVFIVAVLVSAIWTPTTPAARATAGGGQPSPSADDVPPDQPQLGLVYTDLTRALAGEQCAGGYRVGNTGLCTHGPDSPPPGLAVKTAVPPVAAGTRAIICEGDGVSGKRTQVLYVRGVETASRFAAYLESFRTWSAGVDTIYDASAQETGGSRHVRFVTTPDCQVDVREVELPAGAIDTFSATISALRALGHNSPDRKYMLFADADVYCGIGSFAGDDRPGSVNRSNRGPSYGRSDTGCWNPRVAAHELGHNLGAVNDSAPNTSTAGHCLDEYDLMCYNDSSGLPTRVVCPDRPHDQRLDCNHDDYYHTDPSPDSYLGTHWNVADNDFLIGSTPSAHAADHHHNHGSP